MAAPDPNGADRTRPADVGRSGPLFQWDPLTEVGTQELRYQDRTVPGRILEVEMTGGEKVRLGRADDGREYFCHGLTFDGKEAPGGAISPLGDHVPTILRVHYQAVAETQARAGGIVVWWGASADEVRQMPGTYTVQAVYEYEGMEAVSEPLCVHIPAPGN
jgi:hypothetical protein